MGTYAHDRPCFVLLIWCNGIWVRNLKVYSFKEYFWCKVGLYGVIGLKRVYMVCRDKGIQRLYVWDEKGLLGYTRYKGGVLRSEKVTVPCRKYP